MWRDRDSVPTTRSVLTFYDEDGAYRSYYEEDVTEL